MAGAAGKPRAAEAPSLPRLPPQWARWAQSGQPSPGSCVSGLGVALLLRTPARQHRRTPTPVLYMSLRTPGAPVFGAVTCVGQEAWLLL